MLTIRLVKVKQMGISFLANAKAIHAKVFQNMALRHFNQS